MPRNPSPWQSMLEDALSRALPAYLPQRRWFGSKARRIASARVEDAVWLREGDEPGAVVIVRVEYGSGAPERYVLPVALRRDAGGLPTLGSVTRGDRTLQVVEASTTPRDAADLLRRLGTPQALEGAHGGTLRFGDLPDRPERALDAGSLRDEDVAPLGAEQSNTTLRVGASHVFKLMRRFEPGENPEVEIGRFLTRHASFRAAPGLRGSVSWTPAGGEAGTIGALQDRVESEGDGWSWLLDRLERVFMLEDAPESLVAAILGLGAVTADLHLALAGGDGFPAFAPRPATEADTAAWEQALRSRARHVLDLLGGALEGMPAETQSLCRALLSKRRQIEATADVPATTGPGAFALIRLHGDYHLGQTLRTTDGFAIIDFEGEPARPLAERRVLHCALKDVSGMLRSFDYAIEAARSRAPAGEAWTAAAPPLRTAFLQGYETRALDRGAPFLPVDAGARARWTAFFELDKALYEMEYELQNRPTWLHIPARGMLRLLGEDAT